MQGKLHIIKRAQFEAGSFAIRPAAEPLPAAPPEDHAEAIRAQVEREARAQAAALLSHAKAQAAAIVAEGEAQSRALREAVLEEARAEAQAIRAEAQAQGEAEGLGAGRAAGHEAVLDEAAELLANLQTGIAEAMEARKQWLEGQERELLNLALMIAQKVLCLELAHSREAAVSMVEEALRHLTDKSHVRVRVHPMDLSRVVSAKGRLSLAVDGLNHLEVVGDPKVGLGGCLVDTRTGVVDARLATQLAEIAAGLLELAPGPEGAEGLHPMVLAAITALGEGGHVLAEAQAHIRAAQAPAPAPRTARPEGPSPTPVAAPPPPAPDKGAPPPASPEPLEAAPEGLGQDAEAAPSWAEEAKLEVAAGEAPPLPTEPEELDALIEASMGPGEALLPPTLPEEAPPPAPLPLEAMPAHIQQEQDPSIRAAEALAWRLGQLKKGRGVTTLSEELQLKLQRGTELDDQDLAELTRKMSLGPQVDIGLDETLVHNPYAMDEVMDHLRERLGQKPKGRPGRGRGPQPNAREVEELGRALGDDAIDRIVGAAGLRPAAELEAPAPASPGLADASELLAERLGQKTKKPKVRELAPEASSAQSEALDAALGDEAIDAIMGAAHARPAAGTPASPTEAGELEQASDKLARLLGQPRKRRGRPWYEP